MRSLTRFILTVTSLIPLLALFGDSSQAQGVKIGYVHDDKIMNEFPDFTRAQEQYSLEVNAWNEEAQGMQTELDEMLADYEKQKLILSADKKAEREAAIRAKRDGLDAFTRDIFGPGGRAERKNDELLSPLLDKINRAIAAVAEEGGYDVIFTLQSGLGYIKPTLEVTDEVLEKLEQIE